MPTRADQRRTLLVLAKEPVAGKVKTRLTPAVSPAQAATLAAAALRDTIDVVMAAPACRRVLVLDGAAPTWLPRGLEVVPQVSGGLDHRLAAAFAAVDGPTVLVGMDTPQLVPSDLQPDFGDADAWLGPADDGGFWLLGMREPDPSVFPGVPMSSDRTGAVQHQRLLAAGMGVRLARRLRDVDTIEDARHVARTAPRTRFARALEQVEAGPTWHGAATGYERSLALGSALRLVTTDGRVVALDADRWRAAADEADRSLLDRCDGATLDVGCGPGRLAAALAARGRTAMGVDVATAAVAMARRAGATALCRSVFQPLPGEGRWDTVILADGNLGIDGEPARLLTRLREVLRPGGRLLVEPAEQEADEVLTVRLCDGTGGQSALFAWGRLGPRATRQRAEAAGYRWDESWSVAGRTFLAFAS